MKNDPKSREQAHKTAEQLQLSMSIPEQKAKLSAEQMEALSSDPKFTEQATKFAEHMEAVMGDPKVQEQARHITSRWRR